MSTLHLEEQWPLDPAFDPRWDNVSRWQLLGIIAELEAKLAWRRRVSGPVKGGPPVEWDRWILELPDEVFLDCLGSKEREDRSKVALVPDRSGPRARHLAGSWSAFVA